MTDQSDRVKKLLEDPDLQEAFANTREWFKGQMVAAPMDRPDLILDLHKMLRLVNEVEATLKRMVQVGNLEDFRANEQPQGLGDLHGRKH